MRRKDREVTDQNKIDEIIRSCYCCRVGFVDDGLAYIVPLNFGYEIENGERYFYFHGALKGRKNDIMRKNPRVGFELDTSHKLITDEKAEEYTSKYQSVIGSGEIEIIEDFELKLLALNKIMKQYSKKSDWNVPDAMVKGTYIFRLKIEEISCKENM